jgi:hypothetical protein
MALLLVSCAAAGRLGGASASPKADAQAPVPKLRAAVVPSAASGATRAPTPVSYEDVWRDPGLGALVREAAKGDFASLAASTAEMADGSAKREPPVEVLGERPPTVLQSVGRALSRLVRGDEPPRISGFTWAQSNPRHPIYETSVLFTRLEAYTYDKAIAEAIGRKGFSSFMRLDDDYIEVRTADVREAAAVATALAKVDLVRGVFVSPRVLELIKTATP